MKTRAAERERWTYLNVAVSVGLILGISMGLAVGVIGSWVHPQNAAGVYLGITVGLAWSIAYWTVAWGLDRARRDSGKGS